MNRGYLPSRQAHRRGATIILAMMFLVIFAALATAMAIVAQGNLTTADTNLKINHTLSASETGLNFLVHRLNLITWGDPTVPIDPITTNRGLITATTALTFWNDVIVPRALQEWTDHGGFASAAHNAVEPSFNYVQDGNGNNVKQLHLGPINLEPVGAGGRAMSFTAILTPHPLRNENYDSIYYRRQPYLREGVSNLAPLDSRWIRVRLVSMEGPVGREITRAIQMDFCMEKRVKYAILSRSRIMIGRNVMIEGPIGSRFTEVNLKNGHPIQMVSDFRGMDNSLDTSLDTHNNHLAAYDQDGDNRININSTEIVDADLGAPPADLDVNHDGFIDDYDYFVGRFDTNGDEKIQSSELPNNRPADQLMDLVDTFHPDRDGDGVVEDGTVTPLNPAGRDDDSQLGYNDGVIDDMDGYSKVRGEIGILANVNDWLSGAVEEARQDDPTKDTYQDFYQGPIVGSPPTRFDANDTSQYDYNPSNFNTSSYRSRANGVLADQMAAQNNQNGASYTSRANNPTYEKVPYGATNPYDFYRRPIFENMTFTNVTIPKGTNALFRNCTFIGCTYVETTADNAHPYYNYVGTENEVPDVNGSYNKYPDSIITTVDGTNYNSSTTDAAGQPGTKALGNNLRFDNCTIVGTIVSDTPNEYTQVRNKLTFTGSTKFVTDSSHCLNPDGTVNSALLAKYNQLSDSDKDLYRRSSLLAPHYSVEIGAAGSPESVNDTLFLTGTIVSGVLDARGQIDIEGSIVTTFEPRSDTGPVMGATSPDFNTTIGYFDEASGDREGGIPADYAGRISIRYNPRLAMPDGIISPISFIPYVSTYTETGAH